MGSRRHARELAMQALFSIDMSHLDTDKAFDDYCRSFPPGKKATPLFNRLVNGVLAATAELDDVIERFSSNWKVARMACVDRNILRIAVFEMLYCEDIPPKVSINEAIDIGKKFGTDESGAFINGILDSVRLAIEANDLSLPGPGAKPEAAPAPDEP